MSEQHGDIRVIYTRPGQALSQALHAVSVPVADGGVRKALDEAAAMLLESMANDYAMGWSKRQ